MSNMLRRIVRIGKVRLAVGSGATSWKTDFNF